MRTRNFRRRQTRRTKHHCPETLPEGQEITTDQETTPPLTSGSERNNVNGSSSSPDESPSSSRKKPRMDDGLTPATKDESTERILEPEGEQDMEEVEEKRVMFLTQYLCISLWRALESYEIWDSRIVAAFVQGPRAFTQAVTELAKRVHRRMENVQVEAFAKTYLTRLRPTGLYSSCAEILKKTRIPSLLRSLKRKKFEAEEEETNGDVNTEEDDQLFVLGKGKYKHCYRMDEPRLIFINGPQKDVTF
eukprot:g8703.t1